MRFSLSVALLLVAIACSVSVADDLLDRSFEELLNTGLNKPPSDVVVTTATKYGQNQTSAPTAVHVVTREDIHTFGYRNVGEVLRSLPGLYTTNNRQDVFLGSRGLSPPFAFNTRLLILIDGERVNENIFDSSLVGGHFPIDVDLIERIEYAPGSGSAIYGRNAMLGVVNVITRRGHSFDGGELSVEYGSFDTYKARGSFGKRFDNGAEMLLSATGFDREGPDHPPLWDSGQSWDYERYQNAFGKFSYGAFSFEGGHVDRWKGLPSASVDNQSHTFLMSTFDDKLAQDWGLYLRGAYHHATYDGLYPYKDQNNGNRYDYRETTAGQWWDGEIRLTYTGWDRLRLMLGSELQHNFHSLMAASDTGLPIPPPGDHFVYSNFLVAGYLQAEFQLTDSLTLLAGARYDSNPFGSRINPRAGLIWQAQAETTLKLLWGSAYRPPNLFEAANIPATISPNNIEQQKTVNSETVDSFELTLDHLLTPTTRLVSSLYHYQLYRFLNLSYPAGDGPFYYANSGRIRGKGVELSAEQRFDSGIRAVLSYTFQDVLADTGQRLTNSPSHMAKLHFSMPIFDERWRLGLENLYTSERGTNSYLSGYGSARDFLLTNLTVNADLEKWLQISAGVYNLFDSRYADPLPFHYGPGSMPQDGVSFRLKLNLRF